jgi:hypothetical protein
MLSENVVTGDMEQLEKYITLMEVLALTQLYICKNFKGNVRSMVFYLL